MLSTSKPLDSESIKSFDIGLNALRNRGPDAQNRVIDKYIALGHARLSIIDPRPESNQPFKSDDNRYFIIFNGEIYNYVELRDGLTSIGYEFKTCSDTEVLLNLYIEYGDQMLPMLRGMYAFVIYDTVTGNVRIYRDVYGIKPLYVSILPGKILVSSQVKANIASGLVSTQFDREAELLFDIFGTINEPRTAYIGVKAVGPGQVLVINSGRVIHSYVWTEIDRYFSKAIDSMIHPWPSIKHKVRQEIRESIRLHTRSDVPICVFLSGGLDSAALVGVLSESVKDLNTITIVFKGHTPLQDIEGSRQVAKYYGTTHHERVVDADEFFNDLPAILESMDCPSIDGINVWYASKAASELGIKVALSGIGADELLFGYKYYKEAKTMSFLLKIRVLSYLPVLLYLPLFVASFILNDIRPILFAIWSRSPYGMWLLRRTSTPARLLLRLSRVVNISRNHQDSFTSNYQNLRFGGCIEDDAILYSFFDSKYYIRNQLLKDSDWASMFHGVEVRTPFVDYQLLASLSPFMRTIASLSKQECLAKLPSSGLPPSILDQPKVGFFTPWKIWLKKRKIRNFRRLMYKSTTIIPYRQDTTI